MWASYARDIHQCRPIRYLSCRESLVSNVGELLLTEKLGNVTAMVLMNVRVLGYVVCASTIIRSFALMGHAPPCLLIFIVTCILQSSIKYLVSHLADGKAYT